MKSSYYYVIKHCHWRYFFYKFHPKYSQIYHQWASEPHLTDLYKIPITFCRIHPSLWTQHFVFSKTNFKFIINYPQNPILPIFTKFQLIIVKYIHLMNSPFSFSKKQFQIRDQKPLKPYYTDFDWTPINFRKMNPPFWIHHFVS